MEIPPRCRWLTVTEPNEVHEIEVNGKAYDTINGKKWHE